MRVDGSPLHASPGPVAAESGDEEVDGGDASTREKAV